MTEHAERILARSVKIGLWVLPVLPFYVAPSMLFPFITGKNFAFRIIVEIIAAFWVGLAAAHPAYRPRLTPLVKAVSIFVGIVFLADLLSPNPSRAFFSNYERMEGFMMLGHLYLYFLMLVSVFKTRRDWIVFWHVSLATSILVSYFALLQWLGYRVSLQGGFRVDSTIGNPTYLAAYLYFHLWLLGLLIYQFWKKRWLAITYAAVLAFELVIVYFTATRGVTLALLGVGIPCAAAAVWFWNRLAAEVKSENGAPLPSAASGSGWRMGRIVASAALILSILIPFSLWSARNTDFVRSSEALTRLTNYSLNEGTISARFMIWGMSWRGALDRPILGWGQENYYLVYQKYYNPKLFGEEPWFDRSHNAVFDWLIHAGFAGLAGYLAIFAALFWILVRAMRRREIRLWEGLVLVSLFAGYFLQNLFVFDNLNTYLLFFAFLAYAHGLLFDSGRMPEPDARAARRAPGITLMRGYALSAGLAGLVFASGYTLHIKPILEGRALIDALRVYGSNASMDQLIRSFETALSYNSFGDTEVREQISNIARDVPANSRFSGEEKKRYVEFAVSELEKEIGHPSRDVKHVLMLGAILNRAAELDPQRYVPYAERVLQDAIRLSPTRQIIYLELAQTYLAAGQVPRAVDVLYKGWIIEKSFTNVGTSLWSLAALAKRQDIIDEVRAVFDPKNLDGVSLQRIALGYQRARDFKTAADLYALIIAREPKNPAARAVYAALLVETGNIAEARIQTEEAIRLDPSFEAEGREFLRRLENR